MRKCKYCGKEYDEEQSDSCCMFESFCSTQCESEYYQEINDVNDMTNMENALLKDYEEE